MKKAVCMIVCLSLLACTCLLFGGCGKKENENKPNDYPNAGGWAKTDSVTVTDEVKALVQKACETLTGAEYTPVAYLERQVVAGYNHLIMCKITPTVPNAVSHYALVTIYEDLQGGAKITSVVESDATVPSGEGDGAWSETASVDVTNELKTAFETANSVLAGGQYTPLALLGEQVVAGMNYCVLCEMTPTVPDAASSYEIVTLYLDLDGNAEITETAGFTNVQ